jgi:hypothetical protein
MIMHKICIKDTYILFFSICILFFSTNVLQVTAEALSSFHLRDTGCLALLGRFWVRKRDNNNVQLVPPPENYGDNGNTASNQRKQLPQWLREQQEERSRGMYMVEEAHTRNLDCFLIHLALSFSVLLDTVHTLILTCSKFFDPISSNCFCPALDDRALTKLEADLVEKEGVTVHAVIGLPIDKKVILGDHHQIPSYYHQCNLCPIYYPKFARHPQYH